MKELLDLSREFLDSHFPHSLGAISSGSLFRGTGTATSDIDLPVIDDSIEYAYRETFRYKGRVFECFIHTQAAIQDFFRSDLDSRCPALPHMYATGHIIKDSRDIMSRLQKQALSALEKGPLPLSPEERDRIRYTLSVSLDDLKDSTDYGESFLLFNKVLITYMEFSLLSTDQWIGSDKWLFRLFNKCFPDHQISDILAEYPSSRSTQALIRLVQELLDQNGGRLEEGFRSEAPKK